MLHNFHILKQYFYRLFHLVFSVCYKERVGYSPFWRVIFQAEFFIPFVVKIKYFFAYISVLYNETKVNHKGGKRVKYSCGCSNVWGKKGLDVICGFCGRRFMEMKEK